MYEGLYWLTLTALFTSFIWAVYVLNRFAAVGIFETLGNPKAGWPALAEWAQRAKAAHTNAIENLIVFAPMVLVATILPSDNLHQTVGYLAEIYFFARVAHFITYTLGIAYVRTLAFLTGVYAQIALAVSILMSFTA